MGRNVEKIGGNSGPSSPTEKWGQYLSSGVGPAWLLGVGTESDKMPTRAVSCGGAAWAGQHTWVWIWCPGPGLSDPGSGSCSFFTHEMRTGWSSCALLEGALHEKVWGQKRLAEKKKKGRKEEKNVGRKKKAHTVIPCYLQGIGSSIPSKDIKVDWCLSTLVDHLYHWVHILRNGEWL